MYNILILFLQIFNKKNNQNLWKSLRLRTILFNI